MRKLFYVDWKMCGGENLPPEFDLEDFCEVLQGKVCDVEIVPVSGSAAGENRQNNFISAQLFQEALGEYLPR